MAEWIILIMEKILWLFLAPIGFIGMIIGKIYHIVTGEDCNAYYYHHSYYDHVEIGFEVGLFLLIGLLILIIILLIISGLLLLINEIIIKFKTKKVQYEERIMIIVDKKFKAPTRTLMPVNGILMSMETSSEEYTIKLRDKLSYKYIDSEYLYNNAVIKDEVKTVVKVRKDKYDKVIKESIIDYELI